MRQFRKASLLALVCAAALTGCANTTAGRAERAGGGAPAAEQPAGGSSGSGSAGSGSAGSGSAGTGAMSTPSKDELLGSADLPAGAQVRDIDIAELSRLLVAAAAAAEAKYEPAECGKLASAVFDQVKKDGDSIKGVAMVALSKTGTVSEAVLAKPADFKMSNNKRDIQKCGTVKTTLNGQTSTTKVKLVKLDGVNAEQALGYAQELNVSGVTLYTMNASMVTSNRIVTVGTSGQKKGSAGELADLTNKAVAKVAG